MTLRISSASTAALAAAAPLLLLGACNGNGSPDATDTETPVPTINLSEEAQVGAEAMMPTDAQGFVNAVAASNAYEVAAGKLAQQQGASQAVKDFGTMTANDHAQATSDLKAAAANVPNVTVDATLTGSQEANLKVLRDTADGFDGTYKDQQVRAHEQALSMLKNYARAGDNDALKAFAEKAAETVEGHLAKARNLP